MAGSVTIVSNLIEGQSGTKQIGPVIVSGVNAVAQTDDIAFGSATFVQITSPVGATGCVITPPPGNTQSLTLKGVTGDTGIPLQPNQPFVLTFAVPTQANTFGITSGGALTSTVEVSYF